MELGCAQPLEGSPVGQSDEVGCGGDQQLYHLAAVGFAGCRLRNLADNEVLKSPLGRSTPDTR